MSLARLAVRRPVATMMVFLSIILLGGIACLRLPKELFPPITYPQLTVVTPFPNAAPEEVESLVTKKIEEAVGAVRGLRGVRSVSQEGLSLVITDFSWDTDMNFASLNIREKVDLVKGSLPRDALEPTVIKFNPYAKPLIVMSVTSSLNEADLLSIVKKQIRDNLEKVEGVAAVSISGGLDRQITVEVDQTRLLNAELSLDNVINALTHSNLNYPAGETEDAFYEYLIRTMGEFQSIDDIRNVVVGTDDVSKRTGHAGEKRLIRLDDIATVHDTLKERTSYARYGRIDATGRAKSKPNITLSVQKQASANTIITADRVKKRLVQVRDKLPEDLVINIVDDQSIYIQKAIWDVVKNGLWGGVFAFCVLLFFLRHMRSAFIVAVTIPVSLMFVVAIMHFWGLTINMMSLGGLVLGIGMLVDNAIVIMESIIRRRQTHAKDQITACVEGTEEVSGAVSASTYTTIAVFLPLIFVSGLVGQIFKEVAFTVTFSQLCALVVGLSLIPRLAVNEKTDNQKESGMARLAKTIVQTMESIYVSGLKFVLRIRFLFLIVVFCVFVGIVFMIPQLDKEALPKMDQGKFDIDVTFPKGTVLEVTDHFVRSLEDVLFAIPEVESVGTLVGANQDMSLGEATKTLGSHEGRLIVILKDERDVHSSDVIEKIHRQLESRDLGLARVHFRTEDNILSAGLEESHPVHIDIKGDDYAVMTRLVKDIELGLKDVAGLYDVKNSLAEKSPETRIRINKDRAALHGISIRDVAQVAQIAIEGYVATKFKDEGNEIDILVKCRETDVDSLEEIGQIRVSQIPLKELASLEPGEGPSEIVRKEQQRTVSVFADYRHRSLGDVLDEIQTICENVALPEGYEIRLTGEKEKMQESFDSLKRILVLSVIFVYMIMAAQFESLWQPLIIMFTVPLAVVGVVLSIWGTSVTLNAISLIGLVLLAGIVVNNGIVLFEYVNTHRSSQGDNITMVVEACRVRFRPIIMTMLTTLLGVLPLAIGFGGRAELMQPMAVTTFGGLFVSTALTLFVVPCLFVMAGAFRKQFK